MTEIDSSLGSQIQKIIASFKFPSKVGFAVGVAQNQNGDKTQSVYYAGEVTYDGKGGQTPDANTYWLMGSNTKTFTATLLAHYSKKDPALPLRHLAPLLAPYFDEHSIAPPAKGSDYYDIKLGQLANYTSGLPSANRTSSDPATSFSEKEMFTNLASTPMKTPGGQSIYSDLGFALLANALVSFSGKGSYLSNLKKHVLKRLDLDSTSLYPGIQGAQIPYVYGSGPDPKLIPPVPNVTWPAYWGAGGLVTNSTDFLSWLTFNMGWSGDSINSDLGLNLLHRRTTPPPKGAPDVTWAWYQEDAPGISEKIKVYQKFGGVPGFHSLLYFTPDYSYGVSLLSNSNDKVSVHSAGSQILQALMGS